MSEEHSIKEYIKIYFILLVLLIISILGPELNIKILTLITAFGIAIVKALMVAAYFMHLKVEKRYIWYLLYTMLGMVFLFFSGVAADVMNLKGSRWEKVASMKYIEESTKKHDDSPTTEH